DGGQDHGGGSDAVLGQHVGINPFLFVARAVSVVDRNLAEDQQAHDEVGDVETEQDGAVPTAQPPGGQEDRRQHGEREQDRHVPGQRVVVDDDRPADQQDDAELAGHREHDAADDVGDTDLGSPTPGGLDAQEDVLERQRERRDGDAEDGALDGVLLEDALGALPGDQGADDEPDEGEHRQGDRGGRRELAGLEEAVVDPQVGGQLEAARAPVPAGAPARGRALRGRRVAAAPAGQGGRAAPADPGLLELLVDLRVAP